MRYRYLRVEPALIHQVRTVLTMEGSATPDPNPLPLFTNGLPVLLCHIEKNESGIVDKVNLTLFGKSSPAESWMIDKHCDIIAYFFQPFAIAALFNIPAAKLVKEPVDLSHWNPHKTNALRTQLAYAATLADQVSVLNNLIHQQLHDNSRECEIIKYATDQIMVDPAKEILGALLKKLNVTERTFQRLFKKYVGVTPSQYRRICQFQLSFSQLRSGEFEKLTDVAFENGFADQSHFIRAFKEFTHTTPYNYLRSGLEKNK